MAGRSMNTSGPTFEAPVWAGDYGSRDHLIPGGAKVDPTAFVAPDGTKVTLTANAAGAAVALTVAALTAAIPNATVLNFGTNKFARLTAAANVGDTTLTVAAIPTAMVIGDTATYPGTTGRLRILSGTILGRTYAERDTSAPFGPCADADEEVYILYHDIDDANVIADAELYRHNGIVRENFLPQWSGLSSAVKALVRTRYRCIRGAE